jgi:hypothetical protein
MHKRAEQAMKVSIHSLYAEGDGKIWQKNKPARQIWAVLHILFVITDKN